MHVTVPGARGAFDVVASGQALERGLANPAGRAASQDTGEEWQLRVESTGTSHGPDFDSGRAARAVTPLRRLVPARPLLARRVNGSTTTTAKLI